MKDGINYYEVCALILAGIGLFLFGMKIIADAMKLLSTPKIRKYFAKIVGHRWAGIVFGFLTGAISQSGSQSSLIMANLVAGRLVTLRSAIPIVAAANVGTVVIVFLISIDIKVAVLFLVGLSAFFYGSNIISRGKAIISVFLGIGLLLFGFQMLKSGAHPIVSLPFVKELPAHIGSGAIMICGAFLVGVVLRLIAQSTSSVIVITVTFLQLGGIGIETAMFIVFGAVMGSAVSTWIISAHLRGSSRQLAVFQIISDASVSLLFTIFATAEVLTDIPLLKDAVEALTADPDKQLAFLYLGLRLVSFGFAMAFHNHVVTLLERLSPPSREEKLSRPQFIFDEAVSEPSSAVDLIEKEQMRIVTRLPLYLEKLREEHEVADYPEYNELHVATTELGKEIRQFSREVLSQNLSRETSEWLIKVVNRQDTVMLLEENIFNFVCELDRWNAPEDLGHVKAEMVESLHAVLMMGLDAEGSESGEDLDRFIAITGDKSAVMEKMRQAYITGDGTTSTGDRSTILYVTDLYQRSVWLLHQWATVLKSGRAG
jgi:phosphate:Na+ symporter